LFRSTGVTIINNDIKVIGNLKKLEKLCLIGMTVTDDALQYICGMRELTFQNCMEITDSGLKMLIESSPRLEVLNVIECNNIDEDYICKIAEATCNSRSNNVLLKVNILKWQNHDMCNT